MVDTKPDNKMIFTKGKITDESILKTRRDKVTKSESGQRSV